VNTTNQDPAELPEQERVRREKRQILLSNGIDPYGMAFPDRESIRELKLKLLPWTKEGQDKDHLPETPIKSRIAGRIVLLRRFGKAFFATLQDNGD
jgi:lysyl-tRNA synthetase class 2